MNYSDDWLWNDWKTHYEKMGIPSRKICKDGIAKEELFRETTPRVLLVMKEANDWDEGDIRIIMRKPRLQIFHTAGRWIAGLLRGFPKYDEIDNYGQIAWGLERAAWINLKKVSGGATANLGLISAYSSRDRELLIKQIQYITPQIIVACGTFDYCWWLLNLPIKLPWEKGHEMPWKKPVYSDLVGAWVIPHVHPNRANNLQTYDCLRRLYELTKNGV